MQSTLEQYLEPLNHVGLPPEIDWESIKLCRKLRESIRANYRKERDELERQLRLINAQHAVLDKKEEELCAQEALEWKRIMRVYA